jgi:ribosomal protein L12E/L44/L45/RPP1/RPP2
MSSTNEQSLAQAVLQDLNDNHSESDEELPALVEVPLPVAASGASKRKKKSKSKKAVADEAKPAEIAADSEERSRMGELITLTMKKLELQQALPPFGEAEVAKEQRRIGI